MKVGDKLVASKTVNMSNEGVLTDTLFLTEGKEYTVVKIVMDEYWIESECSTDHYMGKIEFADRYFDIPFEKVDIFTKEFLEEIGHEQTYTKGTYGRSIDKQLAMTMIGWNTEGHSVTYFGKTLKPNTSIAIYKDGGTRTVFNGYVFTQDDVRRLLELTM